MDAPPTDAFLIPDPLVAGADGLLLRLNGGQQPILMGGAPIHRFLPGWRARAVFTGFAPLFLLELEHENGSRATWFLGHRLERVGDSIHALTPDIQALLRRHCLALLRRLTDAVLVRCDPVLDPEVAAFLEICPQTRHEIAVWCVDAVLPEPCFYLAADLMPHSLLFRGEAGDMAAIDRDCLVRGIECDWQVLLPGFLRSGRIDWPSPVDGRILSAQGGVFIDDFHFAYRFADHRFGLVFFVLVAEHNSTVAGMWFPCMGLLVCPSPDRRGLSHGVMRQLPWWMMCHAMDHAPALIAALRRGAKEFRSVLRGFGLHLGHQIWNELSGIEHALNSFPDAIPTWLVPQSENGTELYGPIDRLFPLLAGKVERVGETLSDLIEHAYRNDLFLMRITADVVTVSLRDRLLRDALSTRAGREAASTARRLAGGSLAPVILCGLRVENRTLTDLGAFLERLARFVAVRHPGAVLVLDAHNGVDTPDGKPRVIRSHGEREAGVQPVDVEHELAHGLRQAVAELDIVVADTIGQPIAASLGWCSEAACFISIWGASLAKYRWVCNTPGFVLTSHANLLGRSDLRIYDDERYMEQPTLLSFVSPDAVFDDPEASALLPMPGQPLFHNFRIDEDRVMAEIGAMFDRFLIGRPVAAVAKLSPVRKRGGVAAL